MNTFLGKKKKGDVEMLFLQFLNEAFQPFFTQVYFSFQCD